MIEMSGRRERGSSPASAGSVVRPLSPPERGGRSTQPGLSELERLLQQWTEDGVVTPDQAVRMREYVDQDRQLRTSRGGQVVGEALGYLGGAIVVAASVLITAQFWGDLATFWRLVVLGAATAVLLAAGWLVPAALTGIGHRMRTVLWLASTAAAYGLFAVIAASALELRGPDRALLITSGTAAYATALWLWNRSSLQQAVMMVSLALAAAAAINSLDVSEDLIGLGIWAVGLAWALLGWTGLLSPGRLALALGSVMAIIGAMVAAGSNAGMVLSLVSVIAVCGAAIAARDLALLAVGTAGALWSVPVAITKWFPDSMAAAYALLVVGALLVAIAVVIARDGGSTHAEDSRDCSSGATPQPSLGSTKRGPTNRHGV